MAHSVYFNIQVFDISKAGTAIAMEIHKDNCKLGEIQIGRGSFAWKNSGEQEFRRKDWTTFCNILEENM